MQDWVRKQNQQKCSLLSLLHFHESKNSRKEQARTRTRLVRENLFLETPSFWNGYTQTCSDPNRSWLLSLPRVFEQIKCWRAPKKVWGGKEAKSARKLPKRLKSTAAGTQLLTGKDSTAGKHRWNKAKWGWETQRSVQTDGENKPVITEYLLLSHKDSNLTHFRASSLFHCAAAAQWSSLRPLTSLVQLPDSAWLPSLLFCGSAEGTAGLGDHGSNPQHTSPAELQSTAEQ